MRFDTIKSVKIGANEYKAIKHGSDILWQAPIASEELCFTAVNTAKISFNKIGYMSRTPVLQYKIDSGDWTNYTLGSKVSLTAGQKCYWKGNNLYMGEGASKYVYFESTGQVRASGKITSLLGENPMIYDFSFAGLFANCTNLLSPPELPATTLSTACYYSMFLGCENLEEAPELPATTLASNCYYGMFNRCSSITTPPALPATTLAPYCYMQMFDGCVSLRTAPALPATTLTSNCYYQMFNECLALTAAPALPATVLASDCYRSMFYKCRAMVTAPASLPATSIPDNAYASMFASSGIQNAPSIAATVAGPYSCQNMFSSCKSLTGIPALKMTTIQSSALQRMFDGCSLLGIKAAQDSEFTNAYRIPISGTASGVDPYSLYYMFSNTMGDVTDPSVNTTYYTNATIVQ